MTLIAAIPVLVFGAATPRASVAYQLLEDPGKIVFHGCRTSCVEGGDTELFMVDPDGENLVQLTQNRREDFSAAWSPTGEQIAFSCSRKGARFGVDICVMDSDGSNFSRLTKNRKREQGATWSPSGKRLIFEKRLDNRDVWSEELFSIRIDGTGLRRLTRTRALEAEPDWSPNGNEIVFLVYKRDSSERLYVMKPDGTDREPLTGRRMEPTTPAWSPDGTKIAAALWQQDDRYLNTMDADGSNVERVGDASGLNPSWSPDATMLTYSDLVDNGVEAIFTVNVDGTEETRIVYDEEWTFYSPDWQPTP